MMLYQFLMAWQFLTYMTNQPISAVLCMIVLIVFIAGSLALMVRIIQVGYDLKYERMAYRQASGQIDQEATIGTLQVLDF